MNNITTYINGFFNDLQVYEDIHSNHNDKNEIQNAIISFIENSDIETAFKVYECFFSTYWIGIQDSTNPFIELLQKMKSFEENAGLLLPKHRDHYIHSVYVFILGLAIFTQNENYKSIFDRIILDKTNYKDSYDTNNEEFFYRWGIASLFHDIAYPLEITIKQINVYIDFISNHGDITSNNLKVKMMIDNIDDFNCLPQITPLPEFSNEFLCKYPNCKELNLADSIDLLAHRLDSCFNIGINEAKKTLQDFAFKMQDEYFIDHGYYSALIVLRWYYYLIQKAKWNPAYFYYPIVDCASSILLHNFYKHGLMKKPFNLGKFEVTRHPIAFLLVLCDELQDWNRTAYGELDKGKCAPIGFDINISNEILELTYKFDGGDDGDDYISKKLNGISSVLQTDSIFIQGINLKKERMI